jgi:hypothetical protein
MDIIHYSQVFFQNDINNVKLELTPEIKEIKKIYLPDKKEEDFKEYRYLQIINKGYKQE